MGRSTRSNTEPCLLARRGKGLERKSARVHSVIADDGGEALVAPVTRHSAKPPDARDRIVELYGDVPRCELFARERAPGWDCFGDEVESDWVYLPAEPGEKPAWYHVKTGTVRVAA